MGYVLTEAPSRYVPGSENCNPWQEASDSRSFAKQIEYAGPTEVGNAFRKEAGVSPIDEASQVGSPLRNGSLRTFPSAIMGRLKSLTDFSSCMWGV
jgi:hypothetical protein